MAQVLIVVVVAVVAAGIAVVLRRRDVDAPEQGPSWAVPVQLDRADFDRPDAPWLVTVFSSATCLSCQGTWAKAQLLASDAVAVQEVEAIERKDLHDRYQVDAVPMVLVADATGAVARSFVGEPTATDLWAALAELRDPGTVPPRLHRPLTLPAR
ncbi:hypothetical protein KSP35_08550 [Aquihabitans sp. G128]|uniref:hypothetical protein n=1 Tax=Aquihabitans sp. G128 TaxID=2849779 RepID=UPI001C22CA98|nr:hypothetical protein [Aquihabitans sp. G128]QXC62811.1 hypothetical protein KSP35_08550 [Aquihabitans sp. G128]